MRRIALIVALLGIGTATLAGSAGAEEETRTYNIEMYNAFGIVDGSEVRVSGVNIGKVLGLSVNEAKRAVVEVQISGNLAELGTETKCSSEPQSLIAEYFIDCEPAGAPLEEGGTIPASQVSQTVQPDLVQNTLREPFRDRLRLLINEFGTALAGNPETLNEAIRLGAPALTELREATKVLAGQRELIRELNTDSAVILDELAKQRNAVVEFVDEAEDTARISNERTEENSRIFEILDDFLAEFQPTLVELDRFAREQTPLLVNLRAAAPGLNRLALNLPAFNRATDVSLDSLGEASVVGERAFRRGDDEIELLAESTRRAPVTTEILADFLTDLDDPRRATEIDDRAGVDTGRTGLQAGTRNTMGYTGLEGLLNYIYRQALSINQFDKVGHLFRFSIYGASTPGCLSFSSGRNTTTGEGETLKEGGGVTQNAFEAADCAGYLGGSQPGINDELGLPKYDPDVCPNGTFPAAAVQELCNPADPRRARDTERRRGGAGGDKGGQQNSKGSPAGGLPTPDDVAPGLDDLLDTPGAPTGGANPGQGGRPGQATDDLLDFLFAP